MIDRDAIDKHVKAALASFRQSTTHLDEMERELLQLSAESAILTLVNELLREFTKALNASIAMTGE